MAGTSIEWTAGDDGSPGRVNPSSSIRQWLPLNAAISAPPQRSMRRSMRARLLLIPAHGADEHFVADQWEHSGRIVGRPAAITADQPDIARACQARGESVTAHRRPPRRRPLHLYRALQPDNDTTPPVT